MVQSFCLLALKIFPNRNKNRIKIPMSFVAEIKEKLTMFAEFYASLGKI